MVRNAVFIAAAREAGRVAKHALAPALDAAVSTLTVRGMGLFVLAGARSFFSCQKWLSPNCAGARV